MNVIKFLKNTRRKLFGTSPSTKTVYIDGVPVGKTHPSYVIAEIGINHNGDIEIAKKLIDAATDAGCQAVKLQKRTITKVYTEAELTKAREVDAGVLRNAVRRGVLSKEAVERLESSDYKNSTNGDLKYALEFTMDEYKELKNHADIKKIHFFASPWDLESVDFLEELGVPAHKIASASLTDHELLKKVKTTGKPTILSTGMSTVKEIEDAVSVFGLENLILLHTVSTYPAEYRNINLRVIPTLKAKYPTVPIGYSGHESGSAISIVAAALGAHVIERHVTLDRAMFGSDQKASIEPQELKELIESIRAVDEAFGDGVKRVVPEEVPIKEKLRRVG